MSSRAKHFGRPAPEGWRPKVREHVVIASVPGTLAACVMSGEVRIAADRYYKVLIRYGYSQRRMMNFKLDDLRPFAPVAAAEKKEVSRSIRRAQDRPEALEGRPHRKKIRR